LPYEILLQHISIVPCLCVFGISHFGLYYLYSSTNESLLSEYRCELFNKRGIFSPSAGRAEKDIAEDYKDNADFLSIKYPKTADVFFKMSQRYIYDSDLERRRAENGYF